MPAMGLPTEVQSIGRHSGSNNNIDSNVYLDALTSVCNEGRQCTAYLVQVFSKS